MARKLRFVPAGIRLRINPLFVVFLVLWAFMGTLPGVILGCGIVLLHELAHGLAARVQGVRVKEVELYPFGGVARIDEQLELEPLVERRLALAGPAANIALAAMAVPFYNRLPAGRETIGYLIETNLILAIFNLLPALPLDGGRVLRSYLAPRWGYRAATETAARAGQVLALLLFAAGLAGAWHGAINWSLMPVAVFVFIAATREKRQAVYAFLRSLAVKERELLRKGCLRGEHLVALEETKLLEIFRLFTPQRYHFVRILDCSRGRMGEVSESALVQTALQEGVDAPVKQALARSAGRKPEAGNRAVRIDPSSPGRERRYR